MLPRSECRTNSDSPEWTDMEVLDAVMVAFQLERSQDVPGAGLRPPLPDHFQQWIRLVGQLQVDVHRRPP